MSGMSLDNLIASNAKGALDRIQSRQAKSIEKLSTGSRINHAADDASGLAISELLKGQIRGTHQAEFNLQDGVSLLQTADSGVETISDMTRRIRNLAVQSSNDTLTDTDRGQIQKEVDQLVSEIDRQAKSISFNNKVLLTGDFAGITSPVGAPVNQTFDSAGVVTADNRPNYFENPTLMNPAATPPEPAPGGSTEFLNVNYTEASTSNGFFFGAQTNVVGANETMRFQFRPGVTPEDVTSLTFNFVGGSEDNGVSPDNIRYQLYDFQADAWVDAGNNNTGTLLAFTAGTSNAQTANPSRFFDSDGDVWAQAWVETDNTTIQELRIDYASLDVTTQTTTSSEKLVFQAGANEGEKIEVSLPDLQTAELGLTGLSVSTRTAAENAIATADSALQRLTATRAEIGSVEKRLESSYNFNGTKKLNEQSANSGLVDLNYAEEIMNYTKDQILAQSATSAITQANLMPQAILQMLRF